MTYKISVVKLLFKEVIRKYPSEFNILDMWKAFKYLWGVGEKRHLKPPFGERDVVSKLFYQSNALNNNILKFRYVTFGPGKVDY